MISVLDCQKCEISNRSAVSIKTPDLFIVGSNHGRGHLLAHLVAFQINKRILLKLSITSLKV